MNSDFRLPPEAVARLPAALGDTTSMYKWLERGVSVHSAWATGLFFWKSAFGKYMEQPHYRDILRRIHDAGTAFGSKVPSTAWRFAIGDAPGRRVNSD